MTTAYAWAAAYLLFAAAELMLLRGGSPARQWRNAWNGAFTIAANVGSAYLIMLAALRIAPSIADGPLVQDLRGASSPWGIALLTAAYVAAFDLGYYVWHRAQHRYEWLWRIHALHHSDREYDASTYLRTHWLEYPLQNLLIGLPVMAMFWLPAPVYLWTTIVTAALSFWNHADLPMSLGPLTKVISGPEYHRSHHLRDPAWSGLNLASFVPLWDVVFGTYRDPRGSFDHPVGEDAARDDLHRQLLWPWLGRRSATVADGIGPESDADRACTASPGVPQREGAAAAV